MLTQHIVNGLVQGMIYSLSALGFALMYGVLKLIQFAHGEVIMLGAYFGLMALSFFGAASLGLPFLAALLAGAAGTAIIGWLMQRLVHRPLRTSPGISFAMATVGLGFVFREIARLIWGAETLRYTQMSLGLQSFTLLGARITLLQVVILGVVIAMMLALMTVLYRTKMGRGMRAIAQNPLGASYVGVDYNRVVGLAMAVGSAAGGVAGVLFSTYYNAVWPGFAYAAGIKAFAATVVGGITSLPGAVVGGLLLGLGENLGSAFLGSEWRDVIAFILLFVVMVVRPSGLFGQKQLGQRYTL